VIVSPLESGSASGPAPDRIRRLNSDLGANGQSDFELRFLRQLTSLANQFKDGKDSNKALRAALRAGMELLEAVDGCVALHAVGKEHAELVFTVPQGSQWDRGLLTAFIRGKETHVPANLALGRLWRRRRMWGVLAVRRATGHFSWSMREALSAVAAAASDFLERVDQERIRDVRARIDCKIMEQLRPKDLFYQVLHGLHSLTQYDHSASLLIYDRKNQILEVVAERVTWKKGKSDKIGVAIDVDEGLRQLLQPGAVFGFDRPSGQWQEWTDLKGSRLATILDYNAGNEVAGAAPPRERSLICAPLTSRDNLLGLLKVTARQPGAFGPYEAELVAQFLPHASIALQNSQRTESLELNLIQAERKHAMADLARGVAHDVNNALAAVLPLVQQLQCDLQEGRIDAPAFFEDLREIERSIQVSRRIFGGMLSFARGAVRDTTEASLKRAIETSRSILKESMDRRHIEFSLEMDPNLPTMNVAQADLDQLLLNLLSNSRDAMPEGGRLLVQARGHDDGIQLAIVDTGCGILPEHLTRIFEPFFSTKSEGNGLGLAICRSIVWQMQGKLDIASNPGAGTRVTVLLPAAKARPGQEP
jgi:signal transduction histidine kinase